MTDGVQSSDRAKPLTEETVRPVRAIWPLAVDVIFALALVFVAVVPEIGLSGGAGAVQAFAWQLRLPWLILFVIVGTTRLMPAELSARTEYRWLSHWSMFRKHAVVRWFVGPAPSLVITKICSVVLVVVWFSSFLA